MGRVAYELGNVYQAAPGLAIHNSSVLFWTLQLPFADPRQARAPQPDFAAAEAAIEAAMRPLAEARMARPRRTRAAMCTSLS